MATFIPKRKTVRYVRFCFFFLEREDTEKKINFILGCVACLDSVLNIKL